MNCWGWRGVNNEEQIRLHLTVPLEESEAISVSRLTEKMGYDERQKPKVYRELKYWDEHGFVSSKVTKIPTKGVSGWCACRVYWRRRNPEKRAKHLFDYIQEIDEAIQKVVKDREFFQSELDKYKKGEWDKCKKCSEMLFTQKEVQLGLCELCFETSKKEGEGDE